MSPSLLRIEGILILITAAAIAVLNLKRTANLGLLWLTPVLLVIGIALIARARRRAQRP